MKDSLAHSRPQASESRRLGWALAITATFMALEVAGGIISGSLALLADAGHMLTDTAALGLAWIAARLAARVLATEFAIDHSALQLEQAECPDAV